MGPTSEVGRRHVVSGWIVMGPRKQQNSTILKWWEITSYTNILSTTKTINDTRLLAWRLFGVPSTGPTMCVSFLLAVTKVNVNLAAQYFGGMKQVGQIEFRKLLAETLIFNSYYDDKTDNTPEKKQKQRDSGHCLIMLPKGKNCWERKSSRQTANIRNTSATHAAKGYVPIACALQRSIGVQNVSVTMLHAPKTILQHRAEFSCSETQKMACQRPSEAHDLKIFSVTTLGSIKTSFYAL